MENCNQNAPPPYQNRYPPSKSLSLDTLKAGGENRVMARHPSVGSQNAKRPLSFTQAVQLHDALTLSQKRPQLRYKNEIRV